MENKFDTLLMIGVLKALKEKNILTDKELYECLEKLDCEEQQ